MFPRFLWFKACVCIYVNMYIPVRISYYVFGRCYIIVIGQVIPLVGYYTNMDIFITLVFLVLSFTVAIHFITLIMIKRSERYPLLDFVNDLMVFIFRLVWIPMVHTVYHPIHTYINTYIHTCMQISILVQFVFLFNNVIVSCIYIPT